jgi:flavin-dependent dehydrogenase
MVLPTNTVDVVVIGASLSGSATAIELGKAGLRTLLVDKASFPRRKACGEGLSYEGAHYLRQLGVEPGRYLAENNAFFGYRVVRPSSKGKATRELVAQTAQPRGWGVSREVLDDVLLQKAAKISGVEVCLGTAVHTLHREKHAWLVGVGSSQVKACYVVLAIGAGLQALSTPFVSQNHGASRRVGYSNAVRIVSGELHRLVTIVAASDGEIYVTELGEGLANVSVVGTAAFVQYHKRVEVLLETLKSVLEVKAVLDPVGVGAAHFEARQSSNDPYLYLVGDSQESFDPICGMGMSHALATGSMAGALIVESCEGRISPSEARAAYQRRHEDMARWIRRYSQSITTLIAWYRRAPLCFAPLTPHFAGRCVVGLQSAIKPRPF